MRPGGGRAKGSSFERHLAKVFSSWWGTVVRRTPLSGGWSNSDTFGTKGDLICEGGWPFLVEAKKHEGWHLEQLISNDKCPINDWWKQAVDATKAPLGKHKMPLLVFSRNHQPSYLMIRRADHDKLSPNWSPLGSLFEAFMENTSDAVFVMLLSDFLANVNPPKPSPNRNKRHKLRLLKRFPKLEEEDAS